MRFNFDRWCEYISCVNCVYGCCFQIVVKLLLAFDLRPMVFFRAWNCAACHRILDSAKEFGGIL